MWRAPLQPQRRAIRNSLKISAIRSALAFARAFALRDHPLQRLRKVDPGCPGYDCRLRDLVQNETLSLTLEHGRADDFDGEQQMLEGEQIWIGLKRA